MQQPDLSQLAQWERIAMTDAFRTADSRSQVQLRTMWLQQIAPQIYPGLQQDPQAQRELTQYVMSYRVPDKHPLEDLTIRPGSLNMDGFGLVHDTPEFASAKYEDQQKLKEIWFRRMIMDDPSFQELEPEQQQAFYQNLMESRPAMQRGLLERESGLIYPMLPEDAKRAIELGEGAARELAQASSNLAHSFITGFGSLILGPLKWAMPDSGLSEALNNAVKEREWLNNIADGNFLTQGLPSIVGMIGGVLTGPYPAFIRLFAGKAAGWKGGAVELKKGLLERAGTGLGLKAPPILYQTLGGAGAGAIQGISRAITEDRDWKTYLAYDVTFGVGFEFMSRYIGMMRMIRKTARELGMNTNDLLTEPFALRPGHRLTRQLEEVFRANPDMRALTDAARVMNQHGISLSQLETPRGVEMSADILGFDTRIAGDAIEILNRKTKNVLARFDGPEKVRVHNAMEWLDNHPTAWDTWAKTRSGKELMEAIEATPQLTVRAGITVPEKAREYISEKMKNYRSKPTEVMKAQVADTTGLEGTSGSRLSDARGFERSQQRAFAHFMEAQTGKKEAIHGFVDPTEAQTNAFLRFWETGQRQKGFKIPNEAIELRGRTLHKLGGDRFRTFANMDAETFQSIRETGDLPRAAAATQAAPAQAAQGVPLPAAGIANREINEWLDETYRIIRDKSPQKAEAALRARGLIFEESVDENISVITQMKKDLGTIVPDNPYIIVNSKTGNIVPSQNVPVFIGEIPDAQQAHITTHAVTGTPTQIREFFNTLKKSYKHQKGSMTRLGKSGNMEIHQMSPDAPIELLIKVPDAEGQLYDALLHFPTVKSAQEAMLRGKTKGMEGLIEELFGKKSPMRKAYKEFDKAFRTMNPEQAARDFMPYRFLGAQALQQNYYLGASKGKYIIRDIGSDANNWVEFNNLRDVAKFLAEHDPRQMLPDMTGPIASEVVDRAAKGVGSSIDPMWRFEDIDEKARQTKHFGVFRWLSSKLSPTDYEMQNLQRTHAARVMQEKYGTNPVRIMNIMRDTSRAETAFVTQWTKEKGRALKGLKDNHKEHARRYLEGLDDIKEAEFLPGTWYELKSDVYNEMVQQYGRAQADVIVEKSRQVRDIFDNLFQLHNMNPDKYLKHYIPHLRDRVGSVPATAHTDVRRLTNIPDADKDVFFEFLREGEIDPRNFAWVTDLDKLMDIYIRLSGRKLHVDPMMKQVGEQLRAITRDMNQAGAGENDMRMLVNYIADTMGTFMGSRTDGEQVVRAAMQRSISDLADSVGGDIGRHLKESTKGAMDAIGYAIHWSTGAQIAARAWPVSRNLTQSMFTGVPLIGERWWLEGLSRFMEHPRQTYEKLVALGQIDPSRVPFGIGAVEARRNIVGAAMVPYMGADWVNRAIIYEGMTAKTQEAVRRYTAGKITKDKFIRESGMRMFGSDQYNELARIMNTSRHTETGLAAVQDRLADLAIRRSQFIYEKWAQPQAFRHGIGRLAGQYTSWPNNYFNLLKSNLMNDSTTVLEKAAYFARVGAVTGAIAGGMYSVGMNPQAFMPWNNAVMAPGPHYQLMNDLALTINGNRDAARRFSGGLASMIPFVYAGSGVMRAYQAIQEGELHEALLLLASAPINYDLYPRRSIIVDDTQRGLQSILDGYIDFTTADHVGNIMGGR